MHNTMAFLLYEEKKQETLAQHIKPSQTDRKNELIAAKHEERRW